MPIVIVEAVEGRTVEQKRARVKDITEVVMRDFKVPAEVVTVIIHDLPACNVCRAGTLYLDRKR